ncbi:MAG: hypothetical protein IKH70_06635 [Stomatobaculum sp.]|nr:hypothetical protein [Stomatobaculum sp.]
MGWPYFRLHISPFSIPEETGSRLEKAREEWIRKHVEKDMESWQSRNSAPAFDGNPMALDRYQEAYQREADRSAASWCEKFDQELFPEGLEQFLAALSKR